MAQAELPNPEVYLNYLSPADARDFEIYRCATIVILGATLWDIIVYIPDDLRILSCSRLRPTIICFLLSRLLSAASIFNTAIQTTTPLNDTNVPIYAAVFCVLSIGCSSFLFLRRLHAVYSDNRGVRWFFSALWFTCAVCDLAIPLGLISGFIPGTHYVIDRDRPVVALSVSSGILFDTSIFLAISYKIASTHASTDEQIRWRTIVSGRALPRLSRAVLQGGQQYYLIAVIILVLATAIILLPSVNYIVRDTFVLPLVPLTASMASRVFRNLKLFSLNTGATTEAVSCLPL